MNVLIDRLAQHLLCGARSVQLRVQLRRILYHTARWHVGRHAGWYYNYSCCYEPKRCYEPLLVSAFLQPERKC
jgi:hypothetical protein